MSLKPLSALPNDKDDPVIRRDYRSEGDPPRRRWIAISETRDAIREFDGKTWRVIRDKRPGAAQALYAAGCDPIVAQVMTTGQLPG